jgi:hypothetical protein
MYDCRPFYPEEHQPSWRENGIARRNSCDCATQSHNQENPEYALRQGKVRVRGHGADWVVKIDTAPTSVEHQRELETKVRELIGRSNIGLGGGYSIDI